MPPSRHTWLGAAPFPDEAFVRDRSWGGAVAEDVIDRAQVETVLREQIEAGLGAVDVVADADADAADFAAEVAVANAAVHAARETCQSLALHTVQHELPFLLCHQYRFATDCYCGSALELGCGFAVVVRREGLAVVGNVEFAELDDAGSAAALVVKGPVNDYFPVAWTLLVAGR